MMNRSTFLKSVFSAVTLATIPKPILKAIETLPPPALAPVPIITLPKPKGFKIDDGFIYIFSEKERRLLAGSKSFNLEFHRACIDISGICGPRRGGELTGWREYIPGPMSWNLGIEDLLYVGGADPRDDLFLRDTPLQMLFCKNDMRVKGDILVREITFNIPLDDRVFIGASAVGSGSLEVTVKDDNSTRTQNEIGEKERTAISTAERFAAVPQRFA